MNSATLDQQFITVYGLWDESILFASAFNIPCLKQEKNAHLHLTVEAQSTMQRSIRQPTPCHVSFCPANPPVDFFLLLSPWDAKVTLVANGNIPLMCDDEETGQKGSQWPHLCLPLSCLEVKTIMCRKLDQENKSATFTNKQHLLLENAVN